MVFKRHSHCTLKEQPVNKTEWIQIAHWRWRINLKWWSVVDVPPWWHLVSQVLLAFLILGLWGGCWQRLLFCQGVLLFSQRVMSPTSAPHGFWLGTKGLTRTQLSPTTGTTFRFHLPSMSSVCLTLSFSLLREWKSEYINPTFDIFAQLWAAGLHLKWIFFFFFLCKKIWIIN